MTPSLAELRRLAEAAAAPLGGYGPSGPANAALMVAASPSNVLALVERVEALDEQVAAAGYPAATYRRRAEEAEARAERAEAMLRELEWSGHCDEWGKVCPHCAGWSSHSSDCALAALPGGRDG